MLLAPTGVKTYGSPLHAGDDMGRVYITLIIRRCLWVLLLAGCPAPKAVPDAGSPLDASVAVVVSDAGAAAEVVDAGPPLAAALELVVTATSRDGGLEVVDEELDAVKALNVWIPAALSDYRLRVFDEADRVVPSDDTAKDVDGGIDYAIAFVEPLKAGKTYRLTIESQQAAALEGYRDAERVMRVRGQAADADKKTSKKKKH
jgi:hypothetical protein